MMMIMMIIIIIIINLDLHVKYVNNVHVGK
jgi:hypothetical protein